MRLKEFDAKYGIRDAAKENTLILIFALLPFWLGCLLSFLRIEAGSASHFLAELTNNGEVLVVCTALVGPTLYILTRGNTATLTNAFPFMWLFVTSIMCICLISFGVFGLRRVLLGVPFFEQNKLEFVIDNNKLSLLSTVMFLASVSLMFFISVARNFLERNKPSERMHAEGLAFARQYSEEGSDLARRLNEARGTDD